VRLSVLSLLSVCALESGRVGGIMMVKYSNWSSYPIVIPCLDYAIEILACDCHTIFVMPSSTF
jgi:hypothetical protein